VRLRRPRRRARPAHPPASAVGQLARIRLEHWSAERSAIRNGKTTNFKSQGRPPHKPNTNRFDAALVRCIDFEREFSKLTADEQTMLLVQTRMPESRVICQVTHYSEKALAYKIPATLAKLAAILDRASML
jgi:hypothetical protein